ncbi:hypothetical protein Q8W71_07795 [Methylobacterium sp. NEAU 140]|uniref:hypothetical protein n=1 Tax=Methylobacterium sp. NEAU 140 TaxID=3064945 RepID=UPI002733256B|nr:hypothetical protein [Methylobacterium sp. NEAU 140]MDP4022521.1 hypothetical protein [Methylobacterium sp. NEAU 140]
MSLPRLAALAALLVPLPALAQGTPRSIGECERLKNDLAYNQCLAMFGPAAKNVAGGYASLDAASAPAIATPLPQAEEAVEAAPARHGRYRSRRGRQSAVFTSGGSRSYYRRRHRS